MPNPVSETLKHKYSGTEEKNMSSALPKIAVVHDIDSGNLISVLLEGRVLAVAGYLAVMPGIIPTLTVGQQVLVMETEQGVGILGCWQPVGEPVKARINLQNGNLHLDATDSITLTSGASKIEVRANGKIRVDGKDIYNIAEGPLRLQGSIIELN